MDIFFSWFAVYRASKNKLSSTKYPVIFSPTIINIIVGLRHLKTGISVREVDGDPGRSLNNDGTILFERGVVNTWKHYIYTLPNPLPSQPRGLFNRIFILKGKGRTAQSHNHVIGCHRGHMT